MFPIIAKEKFQEFLLTLIEFGDSVYDDPKVNQQHSKSRSYKKKKVLVVVSAYAIVEPVTMMIEVVRASVALNAVFALFFAVSFALVTEQQHFI